MTKKQQREMADLKARVDKAEAQAKDLDSLAFWVFEAIKPKIQELVEEEVGLAIDDLHISR